MRLPREVLVLNEIKWSLIFELYAIIGTFYHLKQRPSHNLANIHSKPVVYVNNGGGRDSYISDSSGGLRCPVQAGHGKSTFYNNLRQYDQRSYGFGQRDKSHTATMVEKRDLYSKSQNHFGPKYKREMNLVKNYQMMMDHRLSHPKATQLDARENGRVFRNSKADEQEQH